MSSSKGCEESNARRLCLTPRETEVIFRLLELAKAGGMDEQISGKVGWAVKVKTIIILGIKFGDKDIPVVLYSRRYARFDANARRWLEELSLIFEAMIEETGA